MGRMHNPLHPGAVLQEWLAEVSVTQAAAQLNSAELWQATQQPRPRVQRMAVAA